MSTIPPLPAERSNANLPLVIRGRRVITPEGERPAAIHIADGVIARVSEYDDMSKHALVHDVGPAVIFPGLVDTHVHINEPGRTEWEGFATATQAAAAGGVTTLIEMPLNSIPATTRVAGYREKLAAASSNKLYVDVGFWGGVVPGNSDELRSLWDDGVFGFKCFLVPSGVDEFSSVSEADLRAALSELAALGAPLLVHAELPGPINVALTKISESGVSKRTHANWFSSRPRAAENQAIELLIRLAGEFDARIHVVHLSSSDSIASIARAKAEGLRLTVETCPHYLTFAAEDIPERATEFKCAPPIRERENRELLWQALGDLSIDMIASDHSPCPPAMKLLDEGDFFRAWGGIASLQLGLSAVWTEARSRGYALTHLARWMCSGPARLAGLQNRKGGIAVGRDADLVIFHPEQKFTVDARDLHHRHKITPYDGRELSGVIEATYLRGQKVFDHGVFASQRTGKVLRRGAQ
jgi:allantoinase